MPNDAARRGRHGRDAAAGSAKAKGEAGPEAKGKGAAPAVKRRRVTPERRAAKAKAEAEAFGKRADKARSRAERARAKAEGLSRRVGGQPDSMNGSDILAGVAAETGLGAGAQGEAPPPVPVTPEGTLSSAELEKLLPVLESSLAAIGGPHWRLAEVERKAWCALLTMAYPSLDMSAYAKPVFWIFTAAILAPRVALSVKIVLGKGKDARPADAVPDGKPRHSGEEGERENDPRPEGLRI
jgi:hypothetical protein